MKLFRYTPDKLVDWKPWLLTYFMRDCYDDCDGAATCAKWIYKITGKDSVTLYLFGNDDTAHAIELSTDLSSFVTNGKLYNTQQYFWWNNVMWRHGKIKDSSEYRYQEMWPDLKPFMEGQINNQTLDINSVRLLFKIL
jgi:hypothetical protein